jgi:hypothetical protein
MSRRSTLLLLLVPLCTAPPRNGCVQRDQTSPDGSELAFEHYQDATGSEIWTINRDGTGPHNASQDAVAADMPEWSPRG